MMNNERLPDLSSLGKDLLSTSPWQRFYALSRPFIGLLLYIGAIYLDWWLITPLIVFYIFVAVVTVTHDVVHGSLGLTRKQTDWALFFMGAVLLESGHAYQLTHLQHHKVFPGKDDPEGDPARMSLLKSLLYGPLFLFKLYFWSLKKSSGNSRQLVWLIAEGIWFTVWMVLAIVLLPYTFAVLWYCIMVLVGSWIYPLLTVHLPHFGYGEHPISQTRSLRGKIIPLLFLELTYHLEHHLYPQVPSHNLKKLSGRLDPLLKEQNAKIWYVP